MKYQDSKQVNLEVITEGIEMRLLTNEQAGEDWYGGMARQFKHGMMQEQLDGKVRLGSQIV